MRAFFDTIRKPLYRGSLKQSQVDGLDLIVKDCRTAGLSLKQAAYVLATAHHETGGRMQSVREGFASTDKGAIAAVTKLFNKGRISTNYALPDPKTGKSYFGRGFVQLTWAANYKRLGERLNLPLYENPDLTLEPETSVRILVDGMKEGLFTGQKLDDYIGGDYRGARKIVNGTDKAALIAGYAEIFEDALEAIEYAPGADLPAPVGEASSPIKRIIRLIIELLEKLL